MELITVLFQNKFEKLIKDNEFYEYAKILKLLWDSKKNVDQLIKKNDILFDIDWQGTQQLSSSINSNLIVFLLLTARKS